MICLPPTMPPAGTTTDGDQLEHPDAAWDFYRKAGVTQLVCEEKHMGSRAIIVVASDAEAARERFGVVDGLAGMITTRTGRPFFTDDMGRALVDRIRKAASQAGLFEELETTWLVLDAEILPWSAKAQELVREHYAAVGAAGSTSLCRAEAVLDAIARRADDAAALRDRFAARAAAGERYVDAYRLYCWDVTNIDDLRVAPFHLLASEGQVHHQRDHRWHLDILARLTEADGELVQATEVKYVNLDDDATVAAATDWWTSLTEAGGEGMVVKPMDLTIRGAKGLVQPAVQVRGREYLRVIYGAEYTLHIYRLRDRNLGRKRLLALREYALGIEALQRFVDRRPLRRVHEAVVGILALKSDPVDPGL